MQIFVTIFLGSLRKYPVLGAVRSQILFRFKTLNDFITAGLLTFTGNYLLALQRLSHAPHRQRITTIRRWNEA